MKSSPFLLKCVVQRYPLIVGLAFFGCAKSASVPKNADKVVSDGRRLDDKSRCDQTRADREAVESAAPGVERPNVRRVYRFFGHGLERRKILICREVDTNFDGIKDVVRTYDDEGKKLTEQADADHNGKIDTWITFQGSRPGRIEIDTTGDGFVDESRFYFKGALVRIQRDTNSDQKSDVFETYVKGELVRMGVDLNFDGRIDRWDVDQLRELEIEAEELKRKEQAAAEAEKTQVKEANNESNSPPEGLSSEPRN